jgi:hypothetical protein
MFSIATPTTGQGSVEKNPHAPLDAHVESIVKGLHIPTITVWSHRSFFP